MSERPFDRPLDRHLAGLRDACGPDAFRLVPGAPDRWLARCPLHPDAGFTLVVADRGTQEPALRCRVGCPPAVVRRVLVSDPDFERRVGLATEVLLWRQRLQRRAAERKAA